MVETLLEFLQTSLKSLILAINGLFWPAVGFFLIGLAVKGRALFADMHSAVSQSALNSQIMIFNVVVFVPFLAIGAQALHKGFDVFGLALTPTGFWDGFPPWVVVLIAVFIGDFIGYWRHRLEHTRLLWPAHAVHHSDTHMTWLTLERFHPINRISTYFIDTAALLFLGMPPFALIANWTVRHYYGYLIHADLPWTYGPFGRIFVSPAMHRWHHCANPRYFYTNYATVFSVFDQAFGTYDVPGPCDEPLGVTDEMAKTLGGQLGYALSPRAYRGLWPNGGAAKAGDVQEER